MLSKYQGKWGLGRAFFCTLVLGAMIIMTAAAVQAEEKAPLKGKTVNINTATVEELMQVPLIDEELATRIVEYREENGDFQVMEELLQVEGFTRQMLRKLKPFLLLEGIGGDECTC
ncbi:MAG: helix-hairpin-helix domain-containing protein [Deltaproteobacteria bacterium]|nr:helix-hairpin-helix domain-containing protein [Deltaproteobacteria bacterium]